MHMSSIPPRHVIYIPAADEETPSNKKQTRRSLFCKMVIPAGEIHFVNLRSRSAQKASNTLFLATAAPAFRTLAGSPPPHHTPRNKTNPYGVNFASGDSGGSRTRDFLDENQTSWTTRRRNHSLYYNTAITAWKDFFEDYG